MLAFFHDYAAALETTVVKEWRDGAKDLTREQEIRGRILAATEAADVTLESIRKFYGVEEQQDEGRQGS